MRSRVVVCVAVISIGVAAHLYGYGETVRTMPSWQERALQEYANRARVNPATELANCGTNCSAQELAPTCYVPVAPLPWVFGLNQSSRFHSASMGKNNFFAHDTPFVVRTDIASVFPESCDGSASCASSGAGSTTPNVRVPLFGASYSGEIINAGSSLSTPNDSFYYWLYEPTSPTTTCSFNSSNGHRYLLLTGGPAAGFGYANVPGSAYLNYWTGDFGGSAAIPKIPSGSHWGAAGSSAPYQRVSSTVEFWANWYDSAGPLQASVVVDNVPHALALNTGRGTATNGAWMTSLGGLDDGGCHRYYYSFQDSTGAAVRYPTSGTLGVGPAGTCADFASASFVKSDFNADSKSDVALYNTSTHDVALWLMNGTSIASGAVVGNPGTSYVVRSVGDYNGDRKADIALQNTATGDVAVWLMNGTVISSGVVAGNPGAGWIVVASGDLNGDGKADLILRNSSTGDIAVWLMNGGVISGGAVVGSPGLSYNVVGIGDFNGDGKEDILLQNAAGNIAEWQMNGTSISAAAVVASPGTTWVVKAVGDVDGDAHADILLRNPSTGDIAAWHMNGFTITSGSDLGTPGTAYDVAGSGDYNGDGKADVLLRDGSGNLAVWLLNGNAITGGAVIGSPGSNYVPVTK